MLSKSSIQIVKTVQLDEQFVEGEVVRNAPEERDVNQAQIVQSVLNDAQLSIMLNKTPPWAIKQRQGGGGKMYTYVPHGYVTDVLNKAFGFDWDLIIDPMSDGKMYALEIEDILARGSNTLAKQNRHVAVTGRLVVRIHDPKTGDVKATITKSGFGSQLWLPTMELGDALKAARSDLLKTCAFQLGIALDLYWNERAEVSEFEKKQEEAYSKAESAKKMAEAEKRGTPINFAMLITKADKEFQMNGEELEKVLGVELDEVMDYDFEQIALCWDKIVLSKSKKVKK